MQRARIMEKEREGGVAEGGARERTKEMPDLCGIGGKSSFHYLDNY